MIRIILLLLVIQQGISSTMVQAQGKTMPTDYIVESPAKKIRVAIQFTALGEVFYNIRYLETLVLQNSMLGLVRSDGNLWRYAAPWLAQDIP